jgi:hypothetical protein
MASFAKIGLNNKVIEVLSVVNNVLHDSNGIEQESIGIDFLTKLTGYPVWVQTSYNTHGNQHPNNTPLRGNFAGIGYTYDATNEVFYAPKPYPSWILNESTWLWEAPIAMPTDGMYIWNEELGNWSEVIEG